MGTFTPTATELNDLAAYIGLYVTATAGNTSATVAYNSSSNAIDLTSAITGGTPASISVSAAGHGTVTASQPTVSGGSVVTGAVYTPTAGYYGADSFTYTTTNSSGSTSTGTVSITVSNPPAPVAGNLSTSVSYGSSSNAIDLTSVISGVTNGAGVTVVASPAHGTINSVVGNTVTYTPNGTYSGADSFTYRVSGPGGNSGTGTVSITVGAPPPPVAGAASFNIGYNSSSNAFNLTASITGGPSTSVAVTAGPSHGAVNSVVGNTVTYTPTAGYYGTDSFSYTATGPGGGPSAAATVTITVATPGAPSAANKSVTTAFNTAAAIDLSASITGVSTSIAIVTPPGHGSAMVSGNVVTFTPTTGYSGADSFTYRASGPGGNSTPATVSITVGTLAPTAGAATMTVALNTATTIDLAPLISGSSITGASISAKPAHGTAVMNGTKVTYTPGNNYFGSDSFSYVAYGNAGSSPPGIVTVTVTGRPDPSKEAAVTALVGAQVQTAQRFSRAQISNFQARMESLHRRTPAGDGERVDSADFGNRRGVAPKFAPVPSPATGPSALAYQPAASLSPASTSAALNQPANADGLSALMSALSGTGAVPGQTGGLGNALVAAASAWKSGALNLSSSTGNADGASGLPGGFDLWIGGGVRFGHSGAPGTSDALSFTSDGISVGMDRRLSDRLAVGGGIGFARDKTDLGIDGSNSRARSTTLAAYASYQPTPDTYIDGLLGYGILRYDSERYVTPANGFARSSRSGNYVFGSLAAGIEYRMRGLLLSPYARLDLASHRLDRGTENGAGAYALNYEAQSSPSSQIALGLRAESAHATNFGWILPRLRVEFQHEMKGDQGARVSYADIANSPVYVLQPAGNERNSIVLGVGSDIVLRRGLRLSADYQLQRASKQDANQALFVKLIQDLDGGTSAMPVSSGAWGRPLDIQVSLGYTVDDNLNRTNLDTDAASDSSYSLDLKKRLVLPLGEHARVLLKGFAGGEKFRRYSGLDRLHAGGEAELQYRPEGDFGSPTYGLFGNATLVNFNSDLRDGHRYSTGVSVLKPLTDRINLFGALSRNFRRTRSEVFDGQDTSLRLNLDYALPASTLYLSGEYRKGDIVSTGRHTLSNIDIAKVFVRDDVFTRPQFYSYRFEGRTVLMTVGYSLPLGAGDSIDLSWRRVQSTPDQKPAFVSESTRYVDNQLSLVYLTNF